MPWPAHLSGRLNYLGIDLAFQSVIRVDMETVAGVAETGDAVDVVVEVFGIPECEETSGTVYFHRLDFPCPGLRDFLEDLEPENSVREVVGGELRMAVDGGGIAPFP